MLILIADPGVRFLQSFMIWSLLSDALVLPFFPLQARRRSENDFGEPGGVLDRGSHRNIPVQYLHAAQHIVLRSVPGACFLF